jgi:hypothetical protein
MHRSDVDCGCGRSEVELIEFTVGIGFLIFGAIDLEM